MHFTPTYPHQKPELIIDITYLIEITTAVGRI
jgi:hypothetical protein